MNPFPDKGNLIIVTCTYFGAIDSAALTKTGLPKSRNRMNPFLFIGNLIIGTYAYFGAIDSAA
jgi:hypothetical protein